MKKMTGKNTLMLFLTAFIWGTAFVAQSVGMDYIGPFTFTCVRSLIGGIFLIPCICFLDKWRAKNDGAERQKKADRKEEKKNVILGGICCGLALCVASNLQQIGIQYTTVGKAGFITACYIIIVPVIGIFLRKKCSPFIWIAVILSLPSLPDPGRGICYWQRRTSGSGLCFSFFHTYSGHRSFLASCRRCKNVLHPVFCLWNPFRYPGITS